MNRKLIIGERIMYGDGHTPLNSAFVAKIRGAVRQENLRQALAAIQARHPLLQAGVAPDKKGMPHFIRNAQVAAIPVRIVERQQDNDWQRESAAEWSTPFDMRNGPLCRVVWIRSAEVSELMLVCHHCICDGASVATLLREVLQLLDQPGTTLTPYTSFNAIQDLIPAPYLQNRQLVRKGKRSAILAWLTLSFVLWRKKIPPKGKDYLLHWKLDAATSAAFVARCKAEGTSVHAALCVAVLRAFQQVKGDAAKNKLITPVDIRRFINAIGPDTLFAYAPTVNLSLDPAAPPTAKGFWVQAWQLKEDLSKKIEELNVFIQLMIGEYIHASAGKLVKLLKVTSGSHDVTFSNMGRLNIPESYQSFEVETIYSPTVAFPWRNPNTLVTTTFRGQMDFVFMSNDSFLSCEEATAIREAAMRLVTQEVKTGAALTNALTNH
ncbi:condensation domain-containing protein [Chitinophaga japonensis]|uniref:Phthiocerol/phthiodiolone dimycocerosyl transferase n=1 Tax=Chitinophaga japonensis TaxID=104662 RepID=A0A562T6Z0_CHIJA|nr:condensation domain-containing protein [Chitinophaga japonensis]TWI89319.1 condensation domain-containing protein [Chitinophaga japonensis]